MINNLFKSFSGILLLLLDKIHPPDFVNQTFVELLVGEPFEICIWIGSPSSFDQK